MSTINFETANKSFREVLGNGLRYQVPRFQRDYAWTEEQWLDLWQDIDDVIEEAEEEHYMGYLVLQKLEEDHFSIIDGQQRLTTLSLIIIAGLYRLQELSTETGDASAQRLETLRSSYIGYKDPVSLGIQNKLKLNRNNDEYFRTYLAKLDQLKLTKIKKSERQLADACRFFQSRFKDKTSEEVAAFINKMASRLIFTTIRVGTDVNAYRVFETLNARGVQLSTPDLLKNYLFSTIDHDGSTHETRIQEIEESWGRILSNLGKNDFSRFLLTEWNRRNPLSRKNDLFKRIKKAVDAPELAFQHLSYLEKNSEWYSALHDFRDDFWKDGAFQQAERPLRLLNQFSIIQPDSLLLAALEKLPAGDFVKLLRAVAMISLRYNVICQKPAKDQEGVYNQVARKIFDGTNLVTALDGLRTIYPSDDEFHQAFKTRSFKTRQSNKKVRYLLARIETHLSPDKPLDEAELTVEHILPLNADESWRDNFGEHADEFSERLGNMTLATQGENGRLGLLPFSDKRNVFRESKFEISKKAANYDEWLAEQIESRQKWLADQACAIWRVDQFSSLK